MRPLVSVSNGTRIWRLDTSTDKIRGIGDIDGDGADDIVLRGPNGMTVLGLKSPTLRLIQSHSNGTALGGWLLEEGDRILGVGGIIPEGGDEILLGKQPYYPPLWSPPQ